MSKRESITRYNLIIKKLRKHPSTFKEISDFLAFESDLQEYNFNISKRTFQRDIQDIRSVYSIDIQFDFSRRVYYIDFEQQPDLNERILEAFDTFNALSISDRLSDYIHFEKRNPQGTESLYGLLHAVKNRFQISFCYKKFNDDEITTRTAEPYALKEFRNRWYVVAKDLNDSYIKSFALDRLSALEIRKIHFHFPEEFNVNDHFKYCFGIISPDEDKPEEVILSFDPLQGKYIKSLQLHDTQEVLRDNDQELRIKLKLYLTHDFIMELLSYGEDVRVIKPDSLISELKAAYKSALKQY